MAILRQCNLCKQTIRDEFNLPENWTSLSMRVRNNDEISSFATIDICDTCRKTIEHDFDIGTCYNKTGKINLIDIDKLQGSRIRQVLRFILEGKTDL